MRARRLAWMLTVVAGVALLAPAAAPAQEPTSTTTTSALPPSTTGTTEGSTTSSTERSPRTTHAPRPTHVPTTRPPATIPETVTHARDVGVAAVQARLDSLDALTQQVAEETSLPDDQRLLITAELGAARSGLASLSGAIAVAGDRRSLEGLLASIVADYRVFSVLVPKVHLLLASHLTVEAAAALVGLADRLDTMADEAGVDGVGVLTEVIRTSAFTAASGAAQVPGMVLPLDATAYPGSSDILRLASGMLVTARTQLGEAQVAAISATGDLR